MSSTDKSNKHLSCLCCQGRNLTAEPTLTSLFLSRAAWGGPSEMTDLLYCHDCGFRTYRRHLSSAEAKRYYSDYRGDRYVAERCRDEVFYSQSAYDRDEAWMASPHRQKEMLALVSERQPDIQDFRVVDFGGGDGRLIATLNCKRRAVFDLTASAVLPGVEKLTSESDLLREAWDLVVCAQTLEHISIPDLVLEQLRDIAAEDGFIYIELPTQQWTSHAAPGRLRNFILGLALKNRVFHKYLDLYSTAFRVKLGILPPLGLVPMREHVNFFTLDSIVKLGQRLSLQTVASQVSPLCGIQVLFRKPQGVAKASSTELSA